ncbi:hypothetical protein [Rhizobium laguerreae]|uniref:hypothetical protein n=1 Tax=Rhizobium laguerreae TaxID=1076926 RepID=UPI001C906B37|nr:hypothetical protein [Rhizobium laguerreae]MBY3344890.1 hypothetical protein [Rhizobium laguerreae]MBY3351924.1 hypothetical protein [Rhizobium laguerreae]MBY3372597.1 hypothetical protein [Rhizobium laguerreae]MBY3427764.1 hypothetical protein [Rhizobium laguerreae]MBY3436774.1 hypothetical protein [Rhizobium laguerreae]
MTEILRKTSARSPETAIGSTADSPKAPPLYRALSFVKKNIEGGGYNHWAGVPATENYALDCRTGVALAEEFISFIGKYHTYGNGSLLGSIVIDMEKNGATRGHKIGFMNTINKYAMAGGYLSQMPQDEVEPTKPTPDARPHAVIKLEELLQEAAALLRENEDLKIAQVALNEHGIHTMYKMPGFRKPDAFRDKIIAYRDGLRAFREMPIEMFTRENEDQIAADMYEKHEDTLRKWKDAAPSREGAIEALKLLTEIDIFTEDFRVDGSLAQTLRLAALKYLEGLEGMVA